MASSGLMCVIMLSFLLSLRLKIKGIFAPFFRSFGFIECHFIKRIYIERPRCRRDFFYRLRDCTTTSIFHLHFHKKTRRFHFTHKITPVIFSFVYKFVYALQFVHLKYLVQEFEGYRRNAKFFLKLFSCHSYDFCMVKCKRWKIVPFVPLCLACIVTGYNFKLVLADKGKESNRKHTLTRVSVNCTEHMDLLQIDILYVVSSYNSLFAPSSTVSSKFRKPPGRAHVPLYGSIPRSMRSMLILVPSKPKMTQSAVTAGCGYLYVYIK